MNALSVDGVLVARGGTTSQMLKVTGIRGHQVDDVIGIGSYKKLLVIVTVVVVECLTFLIVSFESLVGSIGVRSQCRHRRLMLQMRLSR